MSARELWRDFLSLLDRPGTLGDFRTYYSALSDWMNRHSDAFGPEVMARNGIDGLIGRDPNLSVVEHPDLDLSMERTRLGVISPAKYDTIAMLIGDTLRDLLGEGAGKGGEER